MVQRQEGHEREAAQSLPVVRPNAAGIDIGSRGHWVAVPAERDREPVRPFGSFTADLHRLADWLKSCGIETVAMESTGVFWIPLYDVLEERGFEVLLVNAAHLKNVPGRKSDVKDCQWIQRLHSFGLLRGSFRPPAEILELRAYMRQRERLIQDAARHVQHMQKALVEMNLQIHHVVSDLTGVTGLAIVRAIVAGERDGQKLAELRDPRCRQSKECIAAALQGTFKREHLFVLAQALSAYELHQRLLEQCDERIEHKLTELAAHHPVPAQPCPPRRRGRPTGNQPTFEIQSPLHRLCGNVDVTQIPGLAPATALNLIAEVGTDMSRWPTEKHFTSWLNLAPGTRITGGRRLSGRRGPSKNRAGLALRQAAVAVGRTQTALGSFYRRIAARGDGRKAAVATARKMALLFYRALKYGQAFVDIGLAAYERDQHERQLRALRKRAAALGYQLQQAPAEASAVAD
ncbi:MAG TPA: IS110 family transposase [Hyphomicrobiaceae bacterium]|nr:IS110 family transposase [Hyphomicrobiaceae bacterium]